MDDFYQGAEDVEDFSIRLDFLKEIQASFCHNVRILIASLTKEMPFSFDTTGWSFKELPPRS
jgi:hypothetical protein